MYRWHTFHSGCGRRSGSIGTVPIFTQPLGSFDAPLGTLHTRALLAGFGRTQRFGKLSASASVSGGYSFNEFSVAGDAAPAFASAGISLVGVHVNNSAVVRPEVSAWYDVAKHVGIGISMPT